MWQTCDRQHEDRRANKLFRRLVSILVLVSIAGCGPTLNIRQTYEDEAYAGKTYENVLVLAVAADYNARSRFERSLASAIESPTVAAIEYYEIADGDQVLTREKILAAIERHGYDGVIITQIGSRESEVSVRSGTKETKVSRRDDRTVDFFRYNYDVLNNPNEINVAMTVVLVSDFFDAEDAKRIWTAESTIGDKENIQYLVDDAAAMIADRLTRDGIVAD
jgi:hypothetical protein